MSDYLQPALEAILKELTGMTRKKFNPKDVKSAELTVIKPLDDAEELTLEDEPRDEHDGEIDTMAEALASLQGTDELEEAEEEGESRPFRKPPIGFGKKVRF